MSNGLLANNEQPTKAWHFPPARCPAQAWAPHLASSSRLNCWSCSSWPGAAAPHSLSRCRSRASSSRSATSARSLAASRPSCSPTRCLYRRSSSLSICRRGVVVVMVPCLAQRQKVGVEYCCGYARRHAPGACSRMRHWGQCANSCSFLLSPRHRARPLALLSSMMGRTSGGRSRLCSVHWKSLA